MHRAGHNNSFLNGRQDNSNHSGNHPPPYDFKVRFLKKAGRTFRQQGILEIPRGKENGGGHPHRPLVPLPRSRAGADRSPATRVGA